MNATQEGGAASPLVTTSGLIFYLTGARITRNTTINRAWTKAIFTISQEQSDLMLNRKVADFKRRAKAFARREVAETEGAKDRELDRVLEHALLECKRFNIVAERGIVTMFCALLMSQKNIFAFVEAGEILLDPDLSEDARIEAFLEVV